MINDTANVLIDSFIVSNSFLFKIISKDTKESRQTSNPAVIDLKIKLENALSKCENPLLITYIQSIISIPLELLITKYGNGINKPLINFYLDEE